MCTVEYYSAIKKNEVLPFATTWVELESIMLSKVRERHRMISLICGNKQDKQIRGGKRQRDKLRKRLLAIENKLMVTGEVVGGGMG